MVQTTHQNKSLKEVRTLDSLIGHKKFFIPKNKANECNPMSGKPSVMVQIGARKVYIPCEEETLIDSDSFSVLKDAGIISATETFEIGGPFDPVNNYDQR